MRDSALTRVSTCTCTCEQHACTPTHVSHTLCSCMCPGTRISTHTKSHMLCACMREFVCTPHLCINKHPAHRRACPHVHTRCCTHPPTCQHTCAHPHMHVCRWPRSPAQAAGRVYFCYPNASSSSQISGWVLLRLGLFPPGWEPICHCLPWTPGRARDVLQAGNSALSIPRALLFLETVWHEIPPWEASLLSQPEVEPPSLASCMPLEGKPLSDHVSAVGSCGQATSLSHSLVWGPVHGSQ